MTIVCEWWPFHFVFDLYRASVQTMVWSWAPFRSPASVLEVVPGIVLAASAGLFMRARLSPRFVRLQSLMIAGGALVLFLAFEMGRVLLADGRPTLVSVLLKEAALIGALYAGSAWARPVPATATLLDPWRTFR